MMAKAETRPLSQSTFYAYAYHLLMTCIYDLGPDLPIDIFVLYFTLFITMMDCSKTHCSVRVEWVGCGTSAEHT